MQHTVMTRKAIVQALFRTGIWLNQPEISAFMTVLDQDGGGNIEEDEFVDFWEAYSFH